MSPERVASAIDPAVRACAPLSATASATSFGVRVSVSPDGAVEDTDLAGATRVAPALLACVVRAINTAKFGAPGAAGASVVLPITVPGHTLTAAAPTAAEPKPDDAVATP
jgi:hypothetical protein